MQIKKYLYIFLVALLLRLIIMPFFFHADLKSQYYHANFLSQGKLNIYSFLDTNKKDLPYKDTFNYPPLTYYFLGAGEILLKPFLGDEYNKWLKNWGDFWFTNPQIFRQLFILKIPYLIFDLLTGFVLMKLVSDEYKKRILILWFFNPVSLYIIYGLANFDIVPTFFTILSLYLFKQEKISLSGLSLGVGIALKLFPLLILPFFIATLYKNKKYKQTLDFLFSALALPALTILPIFRDFYLKADNGLMLKILNNKLTIFSVSIPYFVIIYLVISVLYFGISKRIEQKIKFLKKLNFQTNWQTINVAIIIVFFGIFLGTRFHPQWLLWVIPFYLLIAVENFFFFLLMIPIFISYIFFAISFRDPFLTLGIISPVMPNVYDSDFMTSRLFRIISSEKSILISRNLFFIFLILIIILIILKGLFNKRITYLERINIWEKISNFNLYIFLKSFFMLAVFLIFFLAVYFISDKGYVTSQTEGFRGLPVYRDHSLSQKFVTPVDGVNQVYVRLKNINLKNIEPFIFKLYGENGNLLREVSLHGGAIKDDDFVKFGFKPLTNIANKQLSFTISSLSDSEGNAIRADTNPQGDLVYKVYRKQDFFQILEDLIQGFWSRFTFDSVFVVIYLTTILSCLVLIFREFKDKRYLKA